MSQSTRMAVASVLSVLSLAGVAQASITGWTGQVQPGPSPASCTFGTLVGTPAPAWDEQQNFLTTGINVDMTVNPSASTGLTPGVISGALDSHIIHWNDFTGIAISGTVTFSGQIVGVALTDLNLDNSDIWGAGTTVYPTGFPNRGLNSNAAALSVVSIAGNTLTFNFNVLPGIIDMEQVRVFTVPVPTPGSLALLGAGGLLASRRRRR